MSNARYVLMPDPLAREKKRGSKEVREDGTAVRRSTPEASQRRFWRNEVVETCLIGLVLFLVHWSVSVV